MKKRILSIGLICIMLVGLYAFSSASSQINYSKVGEEILSIYDEEREKSSSEVVIYNEDGVTITSADLKKKMYGLQLANNTSNTLSDVQSIEEEAFKEVVTTKKLVKLANDAGFSASDEDFENYKEVIKSALDSAKNKDDAIDFFDSMGGIENYFIVMENTIRDSIAVRKYLDDIMYEYAEKNNKDINSAEFFEEWNTYEEQLREDTYNELDISNDEMEEALSAANIQTYLE